MSVRPLLRERRVRGLAVRIVFALVAVAVIAAPAEAQRRRMRGGRAVVSAGPEIGGHVGYNFDANNAVLGVQASFPLAPQVDFYPSFDYYTISNATEWGLNFDLKLRPPSQYRYWYAGAGLNLLHVSVAGASDTKAHLNLLVGLEGPRGSIRPYAEAREILGNGSAFQLVGGLSFRLR